MSSTSNLLPFLYQTRTILRPISRRSTSRLRSFHVTRIRRAHNDIPFESEIGQPQTSPPPGPSKRGTITPNERQVFERIFADIRARGLKPNLQEDLPEVEARGARSAMLIMQQAEADVGQGRPATTIPSPALQAGGAQDRNKALLRFPLELRAAASKALGTIQSSAINHGFEGDSSSFRDPTNPVTAEDDDFVGEGWKSSAHSFHRTVELEAERYPERVRIEDLISSAKSDLELWDVLEKEVFTMPARLGFETSMPEEKVSKTESKARRGKKKTATTDVSLNPDGKASSSTKDVTVQSAADTAKDSPSSEISLYIHGPLYPAYLLLALRRLNNAFRSPSPLVFSVLPRVKELGLESYVLGVSTPFYNELLDIHWTRRGDLPGMLSLLEEMRQCGLYFDEETAAVLNRVDAAIQDLAVGKSQYFRRDFRSSFGMALMTMPEWEDSVRKRIAHWHRAVDVSIQERHAELEG